MKNTATTRLLPGNPSRQFSPDLVLHARSGLPIRGRSFGDGSVAGKKRCSKCGDVKSLAEFGKNIRSKNGLACQCKQCDRDYYHANRNTVRDAQAKYHADHREELKKKKRKHYRANREEILSVAKQKYAANKVAFTARNAAGYAIRAGKLIQGACENCGSTKYINAHHDDYSKPLEVRWLCRSCHKRFHGDLRRMA